MNLDKVIEDCIRHFLAEYVDHPLRYFREIGLQLRLKMLIQERLQEYVKVQVSIIGGNAGPYQTADRAERTQVELRIQFDDFKGGTKTDIVVLRAGTEEEPITLLRYPMGHLDIVSKISVNDVDAAIELKAACSSDKGQRHRFRLDIEKLLKLATPTNTRLAAHFVLVDKSLPIRAHNTCTTVIPVATWHTKDQRDVDCWLGKGKNKFRDFTQKFSVIDVCPESGPYVHIWSLTLDANQQGLTLCHQYAVLTCGNSDHEGVA